MSGNGLTVAELTAEIAAFLTARYAEGGSGVEAVVGPLYNSRVLVFRLDTLLLTVDVDSAEMRRA